MRLADIHPGQAVTLLPPLAGQHLVFILGIGGEGRGSMVEGWHFGIALPHGAGEAVQESLADLRERLAAEDFPDVVAAEMNRHPDVGRIGGHRGVVRDIGVPLGRRRTGVLVDVDVPLDSGPFSTHVKTWARELLKGAHTVAVVVPAAKLEDYEQHLLQQRRTIDLRSPGRVTRFGADALRLGTSRWSRAGGT